MKERIGYGASVRRAAAFLVLAAILAAGTPVAAASRNFVHEGIVDRVQDGAIYVNGMEIRIAGAPLKDLSGRGVALPEVVPGKYVQVHSANGRILEVLVFDPVLR